MFRTAAPVRLRASQLAHAQNSLFALEADETRTASYANGIGASCAPSCGSAAYTVGSTGTGVGLLNGADGEFVLFFTRIGPDPYGGRCSGVDNFSAPEETPGSVGRVSILNFPDPSIWTTSLRPYWSAISRADLFSGNPHVVKRNDEGTAQLGQYRTRNVSISWTVTLTPVP